MSPNQTQKKMVEKYSEVERNHNLYEGTFCRNLTIIDRKNRLLITKERGELIDFINCSYLGLEVDSRIIQSAMDIIDKWGIYFSSSRIRLRIEEIDVLDQTLSKVFASYNIATFSNLTSCHSGVLPLIASGLVPKIQFKKAPIFFIDKRAHATMQASRDTLACYGKVIRIDFENLDTLEKSIRKYSTTGDTPVLITDGIYSMGGILPVKPILSFLNKYGGFLYVDDAHGISSNGNNGCGYALSQMNFQNNPQVILTGSLSKGFGVFGGFAGFYYKESLDYIKRNCISYTFSGPLPPATIGAAIASAGLHLDGTVNILQQKLHVHLKSFDEAIPITINRNAFTNSPIRTIEVGDETLTILIGQKLFENNIACNVAVYPVVAKSKGILRFAFSAIHTAEQIQFLIKTLKNILHI